jgi:probable rRNA maturation factor
MIINFNKSKYCKKYKETIIEAYDYALKYLKVPCKDLEVNIDFISKKQIKVLNKKFRNIDKVTDVLSFPNLLQVGKQNMQLIADKITKKNFASEINPENNCIFLGDLCICIKVAYKQAKKYENTKLREVVYLSVHGLLHLLGYDHMIDDDKKIMRDVEEKIMKHIGVVRD